MSRVITFSRQFPSYHPKKGQPTYFVEKVCRGIHSWSKEAKEICDLDVWASCIPKNHTIRAGKRWKVGDKFSPRVWSGKPYNSKQIIIAPDIEIKKVWDFEIKDGLFFIGEDLYAYNSSVELLDKLAENDGLNQIDLLNWFKYPKEFSGQIISWNDKIEY
jgi:hypothetical protein